ncbi:helix-turn-helix domain-containing protein [Schwartzia sp. (in: firmicutes)]
MNNVTRYCRQAGLSPQDLTNKLRIPAPVVDKWEKGELTPPVWVEKKIFELAKEERMRKMKLHRRPRVQPGSDPKRRWRP